MIIYYLKSIKAPNTSLPQENKGGSSSGELARFELDQAGKVTRLIAGSYYRLRKPIA
jgi:hypothetical protein